MSHRSLALLLTAVVWPIGTAFAQSATTPPTLTIAFGSSQTPLNASTSLTFAITNPNTVSALTGVAFTDTLPSGLVVSTPDGLTGSCGGGSLTFADGSNSISLSGATLAANASCTFALNVSGISAGDQTNTTSAITANESGAGLASNAATVTVVAPPAISKSFGANRIPLNGSTTLSFTVTNPAANTAALTGVGFTDFLPAGITVANPNGQTGSCAGGTITAAAGSNSVSLVGATLGLNASCTFTVNVTGVFPGNYTNTTGLVASSNGGNGNVASANLSVTSPPGIAIAFGAATIPLNATTTLNFTVNNPNGNQALSGIGFTDTLPAGLQVASPNNGLNGACGGGTISATAGSNAVSLSGAALAVNTSCAFAVNVVGVTAGVQTNTTSTISSTEGGTGGTSNTAILTVALPPAIAEAFGAPSIGLNGATTLSFTITNPNLVSLTNIGFSDTLPAGLVVSTPNGLTGGCGSGTISAAASSNSVSLTGGSVAGGGSCTFSVNVTATAIGAQTNTTSVVASLEGGTGPAASASILVLLPPSISKSFGASRIPLNGSTSLSFTITNPSGNAAALTGVGFTDTFPSGTVVSTPNGLTGSCGGGTISASVGSNHVSLSNATLAANSSCTFSVNVRGIFPGDFTNTSSVVTASNAGNGNTASAALSVTSPAAIAKAFGAATIPLNGTTTLSFTVNNPNASQALTGIGFTDTLPAGLMVSTPNNGLTDTCPGGTITAAAGSNSINLSGANLPATSTCTFSVNVTGTAVGTLNNITSVVTSTEGGLGLPASASIAVAMPPVITKAFGAATIPLNGSTSLTFTITNPAANTVALTGIGFTDTFPAGILVATPNGLTGSCGGGTITAAAGSNSVSLVGAAIATSSSCTFSVNVVGSAAGVLTNTTSTVASNEGGPGGQASANIAVLLPPSISESFGAARIPLNGTTSLSFTITNPSANTVALSGVGFTDTLPAGIVVATPNGLTGSCGAGTITAVAGASSVTLAGAGIAANGSCTFSVNVKGTAGGDYVNSTGAVTSSNGGNGNTASANLGVTSPPGISESFAPPAIPLNGTTAVTFTISNPNASQALTGIGFTDTLPAGLVIAAPNGVTGTCASGAITAAAGSNSISLAGTSLAVTSSCNFSVNLIGTVAGVQTNTTAAVTSNEGGTGATASASVTVIAPPTIGKAFGAATVPLNGNTSLSFTIANPAVNAIALTGVGFTDTLPAGIVVATPSGLAGSCGAGTVTAAAGSSSVSLAGASIPVSGSCTFSVNVTGTAAGVQNNTTGNVTSNEGGTGGQATASIAVLLPPAISKSFGAARIPLNGSTSLSFTITNPGVNTVPLSGVGFTDGFPAGIVVATPNGLAGSCGGGTIAATAGSSNVRLSSATIPTGGSCTFSVNVTGAAGGDWTNTTAAVTSANAATGNTASANLSVTVPPTVNNTFAVPNIPLNGTTTLTFTVANPNTSTLTGIGFSDTLPAGLQVSTPSGLTGTCGTILAVAGSSSISLSGESLAPNTSCTFSVSVTGLTAGVQSNTTGVISANETGAGLASNTALLAVVAPPSITKTFGGPTVLLNGTTTLSFTLTNPTVNTVALNAVGFTDTLPSGLVIATPNGLTGSCGPGTITANAGGASISLTGASLAVNSPNSTNSSCTFSVNVTATALGLQNNTTGAITSTEGGTGGTATATVAVVVPPVLTKSFGAARIPLNGSTILSFNISNPDAVALTGVGFTDAFPAGIIVATPNGLAGSCGGGTILAAAGSNGVTLAGATIPANTSCAFSVNVTGIAGGNFVNTTTAVISDNAGTGNAATANLTVTTPAGLTENFGAATIALNTTTTLSFTINNPNTGALSGIGFSDVLPSGLAIATPNGLASTCGGGTITAAAGSNSISVAGASLAAASLCTITVNVTGTAAGAQNNTTSALASSEGGSGATASASIAVVAPPAITKTFGAPTIPLNGNTTLTFTITNPAANTVALTGIGFSDAFPSGIAVATPNGLTGSCGNGTITAAAAATSVSLTGATVATGGSCTFSVNITATAVGAQTNTTSTVTSNEGGSGATASATIAVLLPPSISQSFGAARIALNASTSLSFTITNPSGNTVALAGVGFTDNLPAGIAVATPNGLTGSCGAGTITAAAGSSSVNLAGASIAANSSCTFSVNVKGIAGGDFTNTTSAVASSNAGAGNTAVANLSVTTPPTVTNTFGAPTIAVNATTTLSFTVNNPNSSTLTGIAFSDALPSGLSIATPNGLTGTCGSGTITAAAGSSSLSLAGATLATGASCTFSVNVIGTTAGAQANTTGAISANETGAGNPSNTATVTVVGPPTLTMSFGASSMALNATTTLSFTVSNPNPAGTLTGIGFTDSLPSGLTVATPNGLTGGCGGGSVTGTAGGSSIALAGASLFGSSSCTFSVKVTSTANGAQNNTTSSVTSNEGGTGASASASISVMMPPSISKSFGTSQIGLNATTTLSFTITNPAANTAPLTGVGFTDTFPSGLVVATPNGLTGSCGGGTITATAGSNSVSLAGGSVAVNASCTFIINVTANTGGNLVNTTGAVTSSNAGTGNTATASVNIDPPPTVSIQFGKSTIPLNGSTSLSFTVTNPNTSGTLSGIGFTDTLPAGLVVSTPNGLSNPQGTGCNGTVTATQGTNIITLSGTSIVANSSSNAACTFSVNVTGIGAGVQANSTAPVSYTCSSPPCTGQGSNTATVTVIGPPTFTKSFGASAIPINGTTSLTFAITNPNSISLSGVGFTDPLPAGLTVARPSNGLSGSCGSGTITANPGSTSVTLASAGLSANASCTFSINVTATATGVQNNTTSALTSNEAGNGAAATASLAVVTPLSMTMSFGAGAIPLNQSTTLSFNITNSNGAPLTGVSFSNTLPAGLIISTPNGLANSCTGGTVTANPSGTTISLSNANLPASASCMVTVNVQGIQYGLQSDNSGPVSSNEGGTGTAASASVYIGEALQLAYMSNLTAGDSYIDITNTDSAVGNICANVYAFDAAEEMISCCSCRVTPSGLVSLSAHNDLISNTLTASVPTAIVIKLLATTASSNSCNPSAPTQSTLTYSMRAWNTSLHALTASPGGFSITEKSFSLASMGTNEISRLTQTCGFIQANGGGYGICKSCSFGGLGAVQNPQ